MRLSRNIMAGLLFCALLILPPVVSFAEGEHAQADIKLLIDAATVLQQSRPDLAAALYDLADRRAKELNAVTYQNKAEEKAVTKDEPGEKQAQTAQQNPQAEQPPRELPQRPQHVPEPTGVMTGY
jgi:Skp family chaperone for outer membrane proteins